MEEVTRWLIPTVGWLVKISFAVVICLCGWRCFRRTGKRSFLLLTGVVALVPLFFGLLWFVLSSSRLIDSFTQWQVISLLAELLGKGLMVAAFVWLAIEFGPPRARAVAPAETNVDAPPLPAAR
jgi:hypothetical protein